MSQWADEPAALERSMPKVNLIIVTSRWDERRRSRSCGKVTKTEKNGIRSCADLFCLGTFHFSRVRERNRDRAEWKLEGRKRTDWWKRKWGNHCACILHKQAKLRHVDAHKAANATQQVSLKIDCRFFSVPSQQLHYPRRRVCIWFS